MNSVKDVQRGTANCAVLCCGDNASDHSHVSRTTSFQTKRKEVMSDPQYQSDAMDKGREKRTTALVGTRTRDRCKF